MTVSVDDWLAEVATALEVDLSVLDEQAVLDLARDAAHHVARPAAPLTAFLVGLAVGSSGGDQAAAARRCATIGALAREHPPLA
jgi:hypothetical protein